MRRYDPDADAQHTARLALAVLALAIAVLATLVLAGCTPQRLYPRTHTVGHGRPTLRPLLCAQGWPLHGPHATVGRRPTHHGHGGHR